MADKEESLENPEQKDEGQRPTSAGSKGSGGSKKSVMDTVSKLTVKALKDFRLSEPSDDVDTTVTGAESEGLFPTTVLTQEVPTLDLDGGVGAQTLLSEQEGDDFGPRDIFDEGEAADVDQDDLTDDESEGESDMVVLDPDHVSNSSGVVLS